jgi:FkbM family methyltransferase
MTNEPKSMESGAAAPQPRTRPLDLAFRLADALPRAQRVELAFHLLAQESEEITFRRDGIRWTAFPWDHMISGRLFVGGNFQGSEIKSVLAWMARHRRFAPPRDVIVDLGANIGTSTIPFARQTACRVIAIEPVPEIFAVLCRNIADNGLADRVTCVEAAIAIGNGPVAMISPTGNGGGAEVVRSDRQPSFAGLFATRSAAEVAAAGLSDVLDAHGIASERVAFVWSDTQGSELDVIETGHSLWTAGVPLFVEWEPRLWGGPHDAQAVLAAARAHFGGFIPASSLATDSAAAPWSIAELETFSRKLDIHGTDILLLPKNFEP